MKIEVHIVNAFIDGTFGGNPAAIVLDADQLTSIQKLNVAKQIGLSETAFISTSSTATFKLDFFTPTRQIAHCGHATIASFSLLKQMGVLAEGRYSKETIDGNREIIIDGENAFMEQLAPHYQRIEKGSDLGQRILTSLGLSDSQLLKKLDPFVVNTGNSFLIVPLLDEKSVFDLQAKRNEIETISNELDLIGYYIFSDTTKIKGRHAGTRMFAPRYGITEEAGTGMAAGPLACFLYDYLGLTDKQIIIEQGHLMQPPSPSVINVVLELTEGRIHRLMAGGTARRMSSVSIEL